MIVNPAAATEVSVCDCTRPIIHCMPTLLSLATYSTCKLRETVRGIEHQISPQQVPTYDAVKVTVVVDGMRSSPWP
jgi:hypothetical protein